MFSLYTFSYVFIFIYLDWTTSNDVSYLVCLHSTLFIHSTLDL